MLYIATISFSGDKISMAKGKVCEISDPALVADLTKAGYIIPYEATNKDDEPVKEPEKPKKRKGKKDED